MGQVISVADLRDGKFRRTHEYEIDGIGTFRIVELSHAALNTILKEHGDDHEKLGMALITNCLEFEGGETVSLEDAEKIFSSLPVAVFSELSEAILEVQKVGAGGLESVRARFRARHDAPDSVSS